MCLNVSYAPITPDKTTEKCSEIGATNLITKSSGLYFNIKVSPLTRVHWVVEFFAYEGKIDELG